MVVCGRFTFPIYLYWFIYFHKLTLAKKVLTTLHLGAWTGTLLTVSLEFLSPRIHIELSATFLTLICMGVSLSQFLLVLNRVWCAVHLDWPNKLSLNLIDSHTRFKIVVAPPPSTLIQFTWKPHCNPFPHLASILHSSYSAHATEDTHATCTIRLLAMPLTLPWMIKLLGK
jgi:hypothetical protein